MLPNTAMPTRSPINGRFTARHPFYLRVLLIDFRAAHIGARKLHILFRDNRNWGESDVLDRGARSISENQTVLSSMGGHCMGLGQG